MVPRSDERPNVIGLQVSGKYEEGRATANSTIRPGHALILTTDEQNPQQMPVGVTLNSSAAYTGPLRIAEVSLLGNPLPTSIQGMKLSDPYLGDTNAEAVIRGTNSGVAEFLYGDIVPFFIPAPGDIFRVRVATTANFAIGDMLQAHTDGTFVALASGISRVQVLEDVNFNDAANDALDLLLRVQAI